jgi:hypothetical protein
MADIKLTPKILSEGKSDNGSWSIKQMDVLANYYGTTMRESGWRKKILYKMFPEELIQEFLSLKNAHLTKPRYKKDRHIVNPTLEEINNFKKEVRVLQAKGSYLTADVTYKEQKIKDLIDTLENTLTELRQLI